MKELDEDIKTGKKIIVGASIRCNVIKGSIPILSAVGFEFDEKDNLLLALTGLESSNSTKNKASQNVVDLINLLVSAKVGFRLNPTDTGLGFSYKASKVWSKRDITLHKQVYTLYENKITFGTAKTTLKLSVMVKDVTSDSKTFYEDLVGHVLLGEDIKSLAWVLAEGNTITGRAINSISVTNKLENANKISVYSTDLDINTSNSLTPKTLYIISSTLITTLSLNTVNKITIRKVNDNINIVFFTDNNMVYELVME